MSTTFVVWLACTNCHHRWSIDVARGADVQHSGFGGIYIHPASCKGRIQNCKGYRPECPNCGRNDKTLTSTPEPAASSAPEGDA